VSERRGVAEVVEALGLEEALDRARRYVASGDRWLVERAHPLAVFLMQADRYARRSDGEAEIARAGKSFDERWGV
jgi:hypothetical protein